MYTLEKTGTWIFDKVFTVVKKKKGNNLNVHQQGMVI